MYGKDMPRGLRRLNYSIAFMALPLTGLLILYVEEVTGFPSFLKLFFYIWLFIIGWFLVYPAMTFFVAALLWLGVMPIRLGYYLQRQFRLRAAFPAVGVLLLMIGFLCQFIGTWQP